MIYEVIKLKSVFPDAPIGEEATVKVYARENSKEINLSRRYPTMVVCPGGGYGFVSDRESEPVALRYLEAGFTVLVLTYSVAPVGRYPMQLLEVSAAVALARRNADRWNVDTEKIAVTGFSAGGHLAAHIGTDWNQPMIAEKLGIEAGENKPNALVLCYPVITSGEFAHQGSMTNLNGGQGLDPDMFSLEKRVTKDTPPTFIWHTADDGSVPVENALLMSSALRKAGVPFELHIYRSGSHGLSLCNEKTSNLQQEHMRRPRIAEWIDLAVGFLKELGFEIKL